MKSKVLLPLVIFLLITEANHLYAQNINEELYIFNAKRLALSKGLHQKDSLHKRIDELVCIRLKSEGFDNILFYMVYDSIELSDIDSLPESIDSLRLNNKLYGYCEFIYAINIKTKTTYRLKGYEVNDFNSFYNTEILDNKLIKNKSKVKVLSKYKVERLNLVCLYENYIKKRYKKNDGCAECIDKSKPIMIY